MNEPTELALAITPELNKALVAAQCEMPTVPFDSTNPFLKNRYASLGAVISTSRPILSKNGLAIEQQPYSRDGRIGVKTIMRHVSGECSVSELDMPLCEEKGKSAVQMAGSIITYLRRYAWSAVCGLYADEDTDGNNTEKSSSPQSTTKPAPAPAPSPKAATAPATPRAPVEVTPEQKAKFLNMVKPVEEAATLYAIGAGWIMPGEPLASISLANIPKTKMEFEAIMEQIQKLVDGQDQIPGAEFAAQEAAKWRQMVVPFGPKKGIRFGDLEKNTLWWWCVKWQPKEYSSHGKIHPPKDSDLALRTILDSVREEYEFTDVQSSES